MFTLQNTLYVMTPHAYVHLDNATLRVDVEREKRLQVPLHHIGSVVCFGNVMVSPALMHRLADEGKSLVLLEESGRFKARLEGPVSGNVLLRRAQHDCYGNPAFALGISRSFVAGKIRNARTSILRSARDNPDLVEREQLQRGSTALEAALRGVAAAQSLDELRGVEGEAARTYFEAMNLMIKPAQRDSFRMDGRTRRPPRDRLNALLSFLYALLMNDCRSALEAVGLDPQVGFLHALRPGRAALALDLQEELRAPIADRLVLTLVNRGQLGERDFEAREGGAVMLSEQGRRTVVAEWQTRKKDEITHPLLDQITPLGALPFVQARLLARVLRGEDPSYVPFLSR